MTTSDEQRTRLAQLRETVAYHRARYHEDDAPEISDEAYDTLLTELRELERVVEGGVSEADVVGGAVSEAFSKVEHQVRQWSFDNVFSLAELTEWDQRVQPPFPRPPVRPPVLSTPFSPPSGPATGSFNGLHHKSKLLAIIVNP